MKKLATFFISLVLAASLLLLSGWQFDVEFLKRPFPGPNAMNPMTGATFLLAALSVICLIFKRERKGFLLLSQLLAFSVIGIGLIKIISAFSGHDLHIEKWLFKAKIEQEQQMGFLHGMAVNTAFDFVLYGIAVLLCSSKKWQLRTVANYIAVLVSVIAMLAIVGYLYNVTEYHGILIFLAMAFHTAICFWFGAAAILFINSDLGFMATVSSPNAGGKMLRLLLPFTVVVPMLFGYIRLVAYWHHNMTVELGTALLITSIIIVYFVLTWFISVALNKSDEARAETKEKLKQNVAALALKNEELRIVDERLELAHEGTAAGIWDWTDVYGDEEWWSPRFYELLGYKDKEIPSSAKGFDKLLHPDDIGRCYRLVDLHLQGKARFEIECRLRTKDGSYKWFAGTGQARFDRNGKPTRMVGSIIDIDERKRAQNTLLEQSALIQIVPDAIIAMDLDRRITGWNEGAERVYGIKANEAIGKLVYDIIQIVSSEDDISRSRAELAQKGFLRQEMTIITPDERRVRILSNTKLIKDIEGKLTGLVAIDTDITVLKINEELEATRKTLELNNQYLEQFAYISSHDIKAPIVTLGGFIDILDTSNGVKEEYRELLNMMKRTVKQMQRTNHSLNNILKLRKNLVNNEYADDQIFSLQAITDDIKSTLQHDLDAVGGSIEISLGKLATLNFPYVHFKSIFYNIMGNAIKYRDPSRALVIKVTAVEMNEAIGFVIEDNGLGIDLSRNREKLFGIFKRFHDHVEGTGIGLHIVKSIVDSYEGVIDVHSTVAKGTTFVITFNKSIIAQWN
ncbi:MAG: multi-sensor signal transduction histidine kinase [Bacteroidota bacterium]|nr:multi-sensor signal transduction histidine kinase [Bacteroidota bacterium]